MGLDCVDEALAATAMKSTQNYSALTGVEVRVSSLYCQFGRNYVVNDVSFCIKPGEHVAITGANGSGKSTILRSIIGLHRPVSGDICINQAEMRQQPVLARSLCAWVPQRQAVGRFPLQVDELLSSSGALNEARTVARQLGVGGLLKRQLSTLSGGQLQRVFIARAIGSLHNKACLLLADEPTAALDFAGQQEIAELLASLGSTVVVVTHDRAMVARCNRVFEMAAGFLREVGT